MVVRAEEGGVVEEVDAAHITVGERTYRLRKFNALNEKTCLNQRPFVRPGQKVKKGEIIADGAGTAEGELALGKNALVAFMPWDGYNFEDAILMSERLVEADKLHLDPHPGIRDRMPRDQAGQGGVHPRHPQRAPARAGEPR